MRGQMGRPAVAVAIAATLALATPGAALAEESCPPPPPYGVPAYVIEFVWDQPVAVEYGVATEVRPSNDAMPGVWPMLGGDFAVLTGGCDDPVKPLLITRRDRSRGSVDRAEQAVPGVGTYSDCGTGATWAGMAKSQEVPGQPWTYTIVVSGVRPCEGAYVDSVDENFIATRKQPESTTVTAAVTYYPASQTVPAGEPVTLEADVGVVNVKSLDSAPLEGGLNAGYERPPPIAMGTVTLPPIGPGPDVVATVSALDLQAASSEGAMDISEPAPAASEEVTALVGEIEVVLERMAKSDPESAKLNRDLLEYMKRLGVEHADVDLEDFESFLADMEYWVRQQEQHETEGEEAPESVPAAATPAPAVNEERH